MGILTTFGSAVKILSPAPIPPITSQAGFVTLEDTPGLLFPGIPIIIRIIPLNLMGRSGCAPQKILRKIE
jgi:hypothetical protein